MTDIIICSIAMVIISAGVLFLTWILRTLYKAGMPDMEQEHDGGGRDDVPRA